MEDFDQLIRSKIDTLDKVPGVEFNEEKVWRKIKPRLGGSVFFALGLITLLALLTTVFVSWEKNQIQMVKPQEAKDRKSEALTEAKFLREDIPNAQRELKRQGLIDTSSMQTTVELLISKNSIPEVDLIKDFRLVPSKKPESSIAQTVLVNQAKKVVDKEESVPLSAPFASQAEQEVQEVSFSAGSNGQTLGLTRLKRVDDRFYLTYGLQFSRDFDPRLESDQVVNKMFKRNSVQVPIGLRYNLFEKERRFRAHISGEFRNSFLASSITNAMAYNLSFESNLSLDYRIFSTPDGKRGYLRFRLPIYNTSIINQGVYRPSLYDALRN